MPTLRHEELRALTCSILEASGTPSGCAGIVAGALVDANLAGHDSHGVIRVPQYLDQIKMDVLDPSAEPEVDRRNGAMATIDGKWGWGQYAMLMATNVAIDLAGEFGIGLATVDCCHHIGRVAPYVERVAAQGMVGLAMSSAGPAVAPYGGKSRVLGTNPVAWAVPRGGQEPVSFDIATSFVAEGKLRVARYKGMPCPPGAVVNVEGIPSVDPNDFYDGGALMTFGGHKGSGFSVLAQLLGRGLAGMTHDRHTSRRGGNGPVIIAIDVSRLVPLESFLEAVEDQVAAIHAAEPAEGFEEVLIPGEPEITERARREVDGIDIPDRVWKELLGAAMAWGVEISASYRR